MVKIRKKLNAVYFESSLDTTGWFIIGFLIAIFMMFTFMALGFSEMITSMILGVINDLFALLVPILQSWGNEEVNIMAMLFPPEVNEIMGMIVCIGIAVVILGLFTYLAIKKPEKMRLIEDNANF